jgi:hypothetical protein
MKMRNKMEVTMNPQEICNYIKTIVQNMNLRKTIIIDLVQLLIIKMK